MRIKWVLVSVAWIAQNAAVCADGGALRFSEIRGERRISVFTMPTPLHVGPIDISVLVQDAASGKPLMDVPIVVSARPRHDSLRSVGGAATIEAATNKLMRAAPLDFAEPGWWHVDVIVQGESISFDVEVGDAPPAWFDMSVWIGWPVVVVVVFGLRQWRLHRRVRHPA